MSIYRFSGIMVKAGKIVVKCCDFKTKESYFSAMNVNINLNKRSKLVVTSLLETCGVGMLAK